MACFIPQNPAKVADTIFLCSECCFAAPGSRLVRRCWAPSCINHCAVYGPDCVPIDCRSEVDPLFMQAEQLIPRAAYERHFHRAGECSVCQGSGLQPIAGAGACASCAGSGKCEYCGGRFQRCFGELPTDQVQWWRQFTSDHRKKDPCVAIVSVE